MDENLHICTYQSIQVIFGVGNNQFQAGTRFGNNLFRHYSRIEAVF